MQKRKFWVHVAYAIALLIVFVAAIVATVLVLKGRDSVTEPSGMDGSQPQDKNDAALPSATGEDLPSQEAVAGAAPTLIPTAGPETSSSTAAPTVRPDPKDNWEATTFYVIADVPYNDDERQDMPGLVAQIPDSGEHQGLFCVHLGDIKHAQEPCNQDSIDTFVGFVKKSAIPLVSSCCERYPCD